MKNVSDGLKVSGSVVQKGGKGDPTGTVKAVLDVTDDLVFESEAAVPSGKLSATLTHAGAIPGFKASLSGQPKDLSSAKLDMQWLNGDAGIKCDLTDLVAGDMKNFKCPKAEVSGAVSARVVDGATATAGATASMDAKTFAVSKYTVAAQVKTEADHTLAVVLTDGLNTVKGSWVAPVGQNSTAGVEGVYKVKTGAASASAGVSTKWHPACSGKAVVSSPLPINGGELAPVISLQTSGDVAAKTTAAFSLQVEALTQKYKYGVQFATKV